MDALETSESGCIKTSALLLPTLLLKPCLCARGACSWQAVTTEGGESCVFRSGQLVPEMCRGCHGTGHAGVHHACAVVHIDASIDSNCPQDCGSLTSAAWHAPRQRRCTLLRLEVRDLHSDQVLCPCMCTCMGNILSQCELIAGHLRLRPVTSQQLQVKILSQ